MDCTPYSLNAYWFCIETALNQPLTCNVLFLAPLRTQVNGIFIELSNKINYHMVLYKRVFFSPWGSQSLHKQQQASLGTLGLLEGPENPHHLFYLNTDCRKYILENTTWSCNCVQSFWCLKYRAGIYS